jgi:hypothetical protein
LECGGHRRFLSFFSFFDFLIAAADVRAEICRARKK